MSSFALSRVAFADPGWRRGWDELDNDLKDALKATGVDSPLVWAGLRLVRDGLTAFLSSCGALDCSADRQTARLDALEALQAVARGVGDRWSSGQARLSDPQVMTDLATSAKRAKLDERQVSREVEGGIAVGAACGLEIKGLLEGRAGGRRQSSPEGRDS